LVPVLIHMTRGHRTMRSMPPLRMRESESVHKPWKFLLFRPKYQVPVIRHDTKRQQTDWHLAQCIAQDTFECGVVGCIEEQLVPSHRPIQDVKNHASASMEVSPGHIPDRAIRLPVPSRDLR
jgi:hypothetical protein